MQKAAKVTDIRDGPFMAPYGKLNGVSPEMLAVKSELVGAGDVLQQ